MDRPIDSALLRTSLDAQVCRKTIFAAAISSGVVLLLAALLALIASAPIFLLAALPCVLLTGISAVRAAVKYRGIVREPERYHLFESLLRDPQTWFARTVCFTVTLTAANGQRIETQTDAIFASAGLIKPHFSEYQNQKALIAYDGESAIVLRTI
ncbi:MAG: hypothetical protein E7452_03495 [Ruminococcaceae bacterium]|nr:hypothetical protein [Oscillospiraceae bacterium]